jgi:microcystin-dependent protein
MPVRPLLLPDTTAKAGFDEIDSISQWFLGGSGTAGATPTGIVDDDRYGLDIKNSGVGGLSFKATSGNGLNQVKVDNTSVTLSGTVLIPGTPIGMVVPYAGASAPSQWLVCNGATVSQTTFALLFAVLGTTYNTGGEAAGTFRLPDARGRVILGVSASHTLGSTGGAESVSGPAHTHPGSHSHGPGTLSLGHRHSHSHGPGTLSLGHRHQHSHGTNSPDHLNTGAPNNTASITSGGGNAAAGDHTHNFDHNHGSTQSDNNDITSTTSSSGSSATDNNDITSTTTSSGSTDSDTNAPAASYSATIATMMPFISMTAIIYAGA